MQVHLHHFLTCHLISSSLQTQTHTYLDLAQIRKILQKQSTMLAKLLDLPKYCVKNSKTTLAPLPHVPPTYLSGNQACPSPYWTVGQLSSHAIAQNHTRSQLLSTVCKNPCISTKSLSFQSKHFFPVTTHPNGCKSR